MDTTATQNRIFEAAVQEFAAFGIAGARVERIAKAAQTSKERLYAYFRNKEELYWQIAERELGRLADATKLDATDLPEYAGRLFDYYEDHPESQRLLSWGQLESDEKAPSSVHWQSMVAEKTVKIAAAQAQGLVDPTWSPLELLYLISQVAATWTGKASNSDRLRRRAVVVEAVRRFTRLP
jgi:AcrR family transcriptional regulator